MTKQQTEFRYRLTARMEAAHMDKHELLRAIYKYGGTVTPQTIGNWLRGDCAPKDHQTLRILAIALDCQIPDLTGDEQ